MNEQSRIQSISLELYNKGYLTGIVEGENRSRKSFRKNFSKGLFTHLFYAGMIFGSAMYVRQGIEDQVKTQAVVILEGMYLLNKSNEEVLRRDLPAQLDGMLERFMERHGLDDVIDDKP